MKNVWDERFEGLLLAVVLSAALVPREFNIRFSHLSFSVTDFLFLSALMIGVVLLLSNRDKRFFIPDSITVVFVVIPLIIISAVALFDIFIKVVSNRHIFFRDVYTFSILPLTFFLTRSFRITHIKLIKVLFIASVVLAAWTFLIVYEPTVSAWYVKMGKDYELYGGTIGYSMPSMASTGPLFPNGVVRPAVLMGGCGHLGWFTILTVPLFFEYLYILKNWIGTVLTWLILTLIIMSFLYLISKAAIIGLSFSFLLWVCYSKTARLTKLACAGTLASAVMVFCLFGNSAMLGKKFSEILPSGSGHFGGGIGWPTSTDVRLKLYSEALLLVEKDPFLGIGMGNHFKMTIYNDGKFDWTDKFDGVDSFYLTVLLKLGVMGLFLYYLFFYFIYRAYLYMRLKTRGEPDIIVPAFSGLWGVLVGGLFAYFLHSPSFILILASVVGVALKGILDAPIERSRVSQ